MKFEPEVQSTMDNTHSHSRTVGFGVFEQKQTQTSSYQKPTDVPEAE